MNVQLVVASGSRAGQVIPIAGDRFVIGRAEDCHLKPRSELVSRYHCEIFLNEGDVFVRDMGSKNGVFLNSRQITETNELNDGDKLAIGTLAFVVQIPKGARHQSPKPAKVKSVGDAVARTVALESENLQRKQEDTITDWLLAAGDNASEEDTQTVDASELLERLQAQSEEAVNRKKEEDEVESEPPRSGIINPVSSGEEASRVLQKFFKGGK